MDATTAFCIEFYDDALAPRFPKGTRAFFKPTTHACDAAVVLVEHGGQRMVRYLRPGPNGQQAAALNPAFPTLERFRVEAVMFMVQESSI